MRALFVESVPGVERLLQAGANPTVRLWSYISSNVEYNKKLSTILNAAIKKWKRKKTSKKKSSKKKA